MKVEYDRESTMPAMFEWREGKTDVGNEETEPRTRNELVLKSAVSKMKSTKRHASFLLYRKCQYWKYVRRPPSPKKR